jgi:hypothetical protein
VSFEDLFSGTDTSGLVVVVVRTSNAGLSVKKVRVIKMTSVVHVEPGVELAREAPNASDGNKEGFDSWIAQVKSREGEDASMSFVTKPNRHRQYSWPY